MAPSTVVLLNTPLILLPILLMPKDSPRLDRFLAEKETGRVKRQRRRTSELRYSSNRGMSPFLVSCVKHLLILLLRAGDSDPFSRCLKY